LETPFGTPALHVRRSARHQVRDEEDFIIRDGGRGGGALLVKLGSRDIPAFLFPYHQGGRRTGVATRPDAEEGDLGAAHICDPAEKDVELAGKLTPVEREHPFIIRRLGDGQLAAREL